MKESHDLEMKADLYTSSCFIELGEDLAPTKFIARIGMIAFALLTLVISGVGFVVYRAVAGVRTLCVSQAMSILQNEESEVLSQQGNARTAWNLRRKGTTA